MFKHLKNLLAFCLLAGLIFHSESCNTASQIIDSMRAQDTRNYFIAIIDRASNSIRVRHCHINNYLNGNWSTTDMPSNLSSSKGVSIASDVLPTTMLGFINSSGRTDLLFGLFGYHSEHTSATSAIQSSYSPAIARKANGWIIAVTSAGNIVEVHQYTGRNFDISTNTPVQGVNNNNVDEMPTMTAKNPTNGNTEILLAWKRSNGDIEFVKGTHIKSSNAINWTGHSTLTVPNSVNSQNYSGIRSNVSITNSSSKFYLTFTRRTISSGSSNALNRDDLFVYESTDGMNWSFKTINSLVKLDANVSIAAAADDDFLVSVNGMTDTSNPQLSLLHFGGGTWTELDNQKVLGSFQLRAQRTVSVAYGGHPSM